MQRLFTRNLFATVSAIVAIALLGAAPAVANHLAGATYSGIVNGGGTVSFTVSADGSRLESFSADSVPGNRCTFGNTAVTNIPIVNHAFDRSASLGMSLSGSFPSRGSASGSLRIKIGSPISCDTGPVNWTANAPVPPDRTPPQTTISSGPSRYTFDRTPTFRFRSSEPGSTFRCKLDGRAYRKCRSPYTLGRLSYGRHVLRVRAVDASGNTDPTPAKRVFTIRRK